MTLVKGRPNRAEKEPTSGSDKAEMNLGTLVRAYRAKNRIYQAELAAYLRITKATLCRIELGKATPQGRVFKQLISLLMPKLGQELLELELEAEQDLIKHANWLNKYHTNAKRVMPNKIINSKHKENL